MAKEFTVFAFDPDAINPRSTAVWYDHCAALLLKNRKLDRIALVIASDVYFRDDQFTYPDFKAYSTTLERSDLHIHNELNDNEKENNDVKHNIEGDSLATAAEVFREKARLKYLRNIVLFTQHLDRVPDHTTQLIDSLGVHVFVVSPEKPSCYEWIPSSTLDLTWTSALKKTQERTQYLGQLRFGRDPTTGNDNHLAIDVLVYAAVKKDTFPSGHEYVVKGDNVQSVKRETKYYVKRYAEGAEPASDDDNDEPSFSKEYVPGYTRGFKYLKRDEVALTQELSEVAQFPSTAGMDIFGFIKRVDFPHTFLMSEAQYVVPSQKSMGNMLSYKAFVKSLVDLEAYALVRYVPLQNAEVANCVLIPQKLAGVHLPEYIYGLFMVHIPFKEDEKIGHFAQFRDVDEGANDLMEQFILAKSFHEPASDTLNHPKLHLAETEPLNFPRKRSDAYSPFLVSSPAAAKFGRYLKTLLANSVHHDSLVGYTLGNVIPDLSGDNLFNLRNILRTNSTQKDDWLVDVNCGSEAIAAKLVRKLDTEYKIPLKKPKKEDQPRTEKKLAGYIDVDELLEA